ncbi:MAG: hypothetical protein IJW53_05860 [Clostridia bacterium]|nr:hypothetical protein [Clostridia bacterium]
MKKLLVLLLISVLVFSFTSCVVLDTIKGFITGEEPDGPNPGGDDTCEHVDENKDGKCDKCNEEVEGGDNGQVVPGNGEIYESDGSIGGGVELPIIPIPTNPEVEDTTEGN